MDTLQIVVFVLSAVLLAIALFKLAPFVKSVFGVPATLKQIADALVSVNQQAGALIAALEAVRTSETGYMAGLVSACEATVAQYDRLAKAVEKFTSVVVAPKEGDVLTEYSEEAADRTFRVQEYMAQGLGEDAAKSRVASDQAARLFGQNILQG